MEATLQQIEQLTSKVNFWCDFAIVCGSIALILSVGCALYLIYDWVVNR